MYHNPLLKCNINNKSGKKEGGPPFGGPPRRPSWILLLGLELGDDLLERRDGIGAAQGDAVDQVARGA